MVAERMRSDGFMVGEAAMEALELSREDVLLPASDKGASLRREVTKATVKGPDGREMTPSAAYTDGLSASASSSR
jgi:hypothetical protein